MSDKQKLVELAEWTVLALSAGKARECIQSLKSETGDWQFAKGEAHRTRPYPMGFYANDRNLYWAIGWGCHTYLWPWERWLLRRILNVRAKAAAQ
jgi:hypothetical protein